MARILTAVIVLALLLCGAEVKSSAQADNHTIIPIAFISDQTGHPQIYIMEADGEVRKLTNNGLYKSDLRVSPDGSEIFYSGGETQFTDTWLVSVQVNGSGERVVAYKKRGFWSFALSPNGEEIAFSSEKGIIIFNTEERASRRILLAEGAYVTVESWSPDGSRILFVYEQDGAQQLYTMKVDGSDIVQLTFTSAENSYSTCGDWSPDGQSIAFHSGDSIMTSDIYTISVDGTNRERLTDTEMRANCPRWSSDGAEILFFTFQFDEWKPRIYVMAADGTNAEHLGAGESPNWMSWQLGEDE